MIQGVKINEMSEYKFKPCGCGWEDTGEYVECLEHSFVRRKLKKCEAEIKQLKAERDRECIWSQDDTMKEFYCFNTQCKRWFGRDWFESGPMEEFTYCPYCGLKISNWCGWMTINQPKEEGDE